MTFDELRQRYIESGKRLEEAERERAQLHQRYVESGSERERDEYKKLCAHLQEEVARLKRGLYGQKAERLPDSEQQLSLAILGLALNGSGEGDEPSPELELDSSQSIPEHERKKPRRKPLPEDLPRVEVDLVPLEVQQEGLDAFDVIGEERRETLERRPSSAVVVVTIRRKFIRKTEQGREGATVLLAEPAELPIPKGLAGPGMLADSLVRRWQDHLPLHRLEGIYARDGLSLPRTTLCGWHDQLAELCEPLVEAMKLDALKAPYVCTDATGVLVQQKEKCRRGHFWVLVAPEKHVLFRFSASHVKKLRLNRTDNLALLVSL